MAGLKETEKWENEIYRIEENDPVHGGEDGITNKPLKQLANRTKYLKTEVEKRYIAQDASTTQKGLVQLDSSTDSNAEDKAATPKAVNTVKLLVNAVRSALSNYIPNSKKSNADNSSSSDTIATSYALKKVRDIATTRATDTTAGQTVLSHKINGTDKTKAATEFALNELNKELAGKGVPLGAIVSFPKGINPQGYLRAIGGKFNRATYPDLYVANGNSEILPNLHRSDVGMTAYFATDSIPEGWIAFDSIRSTVTQQNYPELYQYLVDKYGSISNVPLAEDRFIRNVGNGLRVGQTQNDAIRNIKGILFGGDNYDHQFLGDRLSANGVFELKFENSKKGIAGYEESKGVRELHFDASRVVPTSDENRPRSIVLKLCIKSKNTFDEVNFWIKAFGVVENAGALDAGTLAQRLQEKADIKHNHRARDITDFNQATQSVVHNLFNQLHSETGWQKIPSGLILQWGYVNCNVDTVQTISFPISFSRNCLGIVTGQTAQNGQHQNVGDYKGRIGEISYGNITKSTFKIANDGAACKAFWMAIGY